MLEIYDQYYIKDCLGYFVINNANTNYCMITTILEQLSQKNMLSYNSLQHYLRYNGHIINLSMQAILFWSLPEKVILNDRKGQNEGFTITKLKRWQNISLIRELHNIIVYIKTSPQRTQVFLGINRGKIIKQKHGTCCNL